MQGHPRPSVFWTPTLARGGNGVDVLGSWLREMCEPHASDAGKAAITDAAVDPNQVGRDYRGALKAGIDPVLRDGGAAWHRVRAEGKSGVTECARSDLDADTRYLGGCERDRGPAYRRGPARDGGARHAGQCRGTARVPPLAGAFRRRPRRRGSAVRACRGARFGLLVGQPRVRASRPAVSQVLSHARRHGRGDTRAVQRASRRPGAVCERPRTRGALMVSRAVNETGLSPPRGAFVSPIRLALVDEVNAGVVDTRIVTRLSGDGRITWRNRKAALRTDAATATIVCACNTGHVPRLSLHDAAVAARLREIPYPTVRNPDPDFGARMRTPARNCGPERSCRTRRTSTARPAVAVPRAGRPAHPITGAARARRGTPRGRRAARPSAAPASGRGTTRSPREAIPRDACPTRRPAARRSLRRRRGVRR